MSFKPPSSLFFDKHIFSVKLVGLLDADVEVFLSAVERIDDYRNLALGVARDALDNAQAENDRYVELQSQITNLTNEIAKLKSETSLKRSEISKLTHRIVTLKSEKSDIDNAITANNNTFSQILSEIDSKSGVRNALDVKITEKEGRLKSLKNDVNMFPSEISEFFGQGTKTMWLYVALAALPIIVITLVFVMLIIGAADLTTIFKKLPDYSAYSILITRMPYVFISGAIITACYKICKFLLAEVIKINQQKLNLTKISIIAKDVSISSEKGLSIQDNEIYELRTRLKMELLREHLKDYLSKDFFTGFSGGDYSKIPRRKTAAEIDEIDDRDAAA